MNDADFDVLDPNFLAKLEVQSIISPIFRNTPQETLDRKVKVYKPETNEVVGEAKWVDVHIGLLKAHELEIQHDGKRPPEIICTVCKARVKVGRKGSVPRTCTDGCICPCGKKTSHATSLKAAKLGQRALCHSCAGKKMAASKTPEQRSEIARRAHAALTPEQRSERARRGAAKKSPEERSRIARQACAALSPQERSERARRRQAAKTPEERAAAMAKVRAYQTPEQRNANLALTSEQRSAIARNLMAAKTAEERSAFARKGGAANAAKTKAERSETSRKGQAALTSEQRSETAHKRRESMTAEQKEAMARNFSEGTRKGWETRRRKAEQAK